jgi:glyoxylase-like metal-dependent hydrolase (beta-lactamase superfamily II)
MDMPDDKPPRRAPIEVVPGIYQIPGRRRSAHAYLIKGTVKNVLIDACLPDSTDHVCACLAGAGLAPEDIDLVLLTHEHIDHAGGAPFFGRHALVAAHRLAANKLTLRDEFVLMSGAFGAVSDEFRIDLILGEETTISLGNYELRVMATPGHCSGAVCFYEPTHHLLFSGDVVMANGVVGGVLQSGNISDYIHSLRRLSSLKVDRLLPGHGPLSDSGEDDILAGVKRLEALLEDSRELFQVVQHSKFGFAHIMRSVRDLNK